MNDTDLHPALTAVLPALGANAPIPWRQVYLTDLVEVERLLDELDWDGCAEKRLVVAGDGFVVRWR
jgi:hypothetical protein